MLQTPLRPEIHRSPANWSDTRRLHITAILKPPDLRQMRALRTHEDVGKIAA
jgi:hypothetical protein